MTLFVKIQRDMKITSQASYCVVPLCLLHLLTSKTNKPKLSCFQIVGFSWFFNWRINISKYKFFTKNGMFCG